MIVDLAFPVLSSHTIPADHGYPIYAALSRLLPEAHQADGFGVHPIAGRQLGGRTLQLTEHSRLTIRTDAEQIARFLPLAGKPLRLLDRILRVGVPQVHALVPAAALRSRLVTIKLPETVSQEDKIARESFLAAIERQLLVIGVSPEARCSLGKRRTLCIKGKEVFGYEALLERLSPEESLSVQTAGIGGRRKMGCGIFTPMAAREAVKSC
jgi:CRISPR-associated protein Cas6